MGLMWREPVSSLLEARWIPRNGIKIWNGGDIVSSIATSTDGKFINYYTLLHSIAYHKMLKLYDIFLNFSLVLARRQTLFNLRLHHKREGILIPHLGINYGHFTISHHFRGQIILIIIIIIYRLSLLLFHPTLTPWPLAVFWKLMLWAYAKDGTRPISVKAKDHIRRRCCPLVSQEVVSNTQRFRKVGKVSKPLFLHSAFELWTLIPQLFRWNCYSLVPLLFDVSDGIIENA